MYNLLTFLSIIILIFSLRLDCDEVSCSILCVTSSHMPVHNKLHIELLSCFLCLLVVYETCTKPTSILGKIKYYSLHGGQKLQAYRANMNIIAPTEQPTIQHVGCLKCPSSFAPLQLQKKKKRVTVFLSLQFSDIQCNQMSTVIPKRKKGTYLVKIDCYKISPTVTGSTVTSMKHVYKLG